MKVLVAHSFYRQGGGENKHVESLLETLEERHHTQLLRLENSELKDSVATSLRMIRSPRTDKDVANVIRHFKPDVIHLHNSYPAFGPSIFLTARKLDIPLVMTVHNWRLRCPNGYMFTEGQLCQRCLGGNYANAATHQCFPSRRQGVAYAVALWTHRFLMDVERDVNIFIGPSRFVGRRLLDWGLQDRRVRVVRHFVDARSGIDPARATEGLFLGRLSTEKGVEVLLRALAQAGDPPFRIAGDGPLLPKLVAMKESIGLKRTTFLGWLPAENAARLVNEARYVVVPSIWDEPAPLSASEAMGSGRPVIVSKIGGLAELVEERAAIGAAPGDVGDLATRIGELAAGDDECRNLGRAGFDFAKRELSRDRHLAGLESAYRAATES